MMTAIVSSVGRLLLCWVLVCNCFMVVSRAESLQDFAKLSAELPTQSIRVAQPFELRLIVESPEPVRVGFADPLQQSLGEFDITSRRSVGPIPVNANQSDAPNRYRTTLVLLLETVRAGQRDIPAVNVQVTSGEDFIILTSDAVRVNVEGVVPDDFDPTQFRDLKPLAEIDLSADPARSWQWLLIVVACLIVGLMFFWRKTRTSDAAIRGRWIAEIDALETDVHNRAMALPIAHDEACARIRQWVQWSSRIPATSLPTDQLIDELRSQSWSDPMLDRLLNMLCRNDRLKFAADAEPADHLSDVFDDARWLIRHVTNSDASEADA